MIDKQLIIIGGGPAGLAAAVAAFDSGVKDILVLERENSLGGILNQCIHNGFGLHRFKQELTGPEYARRYVDMVSERGIECRTRCMVLNVSSDKEVSVISENGIENFKAGAIILAMGCRERTRGAINISGTRPAGVFTAGTAQKFVNIMGLMPGKKVVILGSGDIGLIMARRMTLEGAKVEAVLELMPYSGGLKRNIVQCLKDFDIPLYLSHTVTQIHGIERVEGVTVAKVDENRKPIKDSERFIECDTLLLSVGLIPENELTKGMDIDLNPRTFGAEVDENRCAAEGVFACGNVLHVHDLVDFVSEEAEIAGKSAAIYLIGKKRDGSFVKVTAGEGVSYVVPQRVSEGEKEVTFMLRVRGELKDVELQVLSDGKVLKKQRKAKVAPGEMERIAVKCDFKENIEIRLVKL